MYVDVYVYVCMYVYVHLHEYENKMADASAHGRGSFIDTHSPLCLGKTCQNRALKILNAPFSGFEFMPRKIRISQFQARFCKQCPQSLVLEHFQP